ncbi:hypothetical protein NIES4071_03540 [Calothrix sp. NIES-4071]|nr:hypothetical protein NIES4071_03540 [Calothrix sp. NIES-4071]BAZ54700.1 hypothetical protein NIES4105_03530 [Calothrix sp. NIES-4105]
MSSEQQKPKIDFSNANEPPHTISPDQPEAPLHPDDKINHLDDDHETNPQDNLNQVAKVNIHSD